MIWASNQLAGQSNLIMVKPHGNCKLVHYIWYWYYQWGTEKQLLLCICVAITSRGEGNGVCGNTQFAVQLYHCSVWSCWRLELAQHWAVHVFFNICSMCTINGFGHSARMPERKAVKSWQSGLLHIYWRSFASPSTSWLAAILWGHLRHLLWISRLECKAKTFCSSRLLIHQTWKPPHYENQLPIEVNCC